MPDFSFSRRFIAASAAAFSVVLLAGAAFADLLPPSFCIDGQCVSVDESSVTPTPTPEPTNPTPGRYDINWNPGLYFGYRGHEFVDLPAGGAADKIRRSTMCRAGSEDVQGLRIRFNWRELEPNGGGVYDFAVIDELLELFRTGGCDNRARRLILITDFFSTNKQAREMLCVPPDLEGQAVRFANDAGRERCVAPIWKSGAVQNRYRALVRALLQRYKNEPLIEYFSAKGEGALGYSKKDDPSFNYSVYFDELLNLASIAKEVAPSIAYAFGTNNFQTGTDDWLITKVQPLMDRTPGMGIRWPDTFHHTSWHSEAPFTRHHAYHPSLAGKYLMAGDLQIPGNRFASFEDAWQACCNPQGYRGVGADSSAFIPASSDHSYAASHIVALSGYAKFPLSEAARVWKSHNNQMYSTSCPSSWTSQGARCVTGRVD